MKKYPEERKNAIINKMLPPLSMSVPELVELEKIPYGTLYTWKKTYVDKVVKGMPAKGFSSKKWTIEQKLAVIIETSTLNEQERNEYCRKHGLYNTDIDTWKANFMMEKEHSVKNNDDNKAKLKQLRSENNALKKELHRKEKALAETAALLVLRKKLDAFWDENEAA